MSLNAKEEMWVRKQVMREDQQTASQSELIEPLGATTLFECGPSKCEHDYTGEEAVLNERGQVVGGTTVCVKCGARAIDEAYWM